MYSFSLFPEEYQPSCTANFSRLSRVMLSLEFDPKLSENNEILDVRIYNRNTNILRLLSGLGGLAYSY